MLRTHDVNNHDFDELDPWGSILQDIAWAIRSIYHTTNKASPGKLVFGREMMFNPYIPNWENIRAHKQLLTNKNIIAETK